MRARVLAVASLMVSWTALAQESPGEIDPSFVYAIPEHRLPDSTDLVPMRRWWEHAGYMVVESLLTPEPDSAAIVTLTRIDENGARIGDFGSVGRLAVRLPGPYNVSTAGTWMSDDGLALGGFKPVGPPEQSVAAVVRLDARGRLDTAFGDGGVVVLDVTGQLDRVAAIQQLRDGSLALLVWSRIAAPVGGCWSDRTALWYLSVDGRQREEVATSERNATAGASCRANVGLLAGDDDQDVYRVAWNTENGVFDAATQNPLSTGNGHYGPFTFFWYYPLFYSLVHGSSIELRGGPRPSVPGTHEYSNLGQLAGFGDEPVTWGPLELAGDTIYLAFATDGGRIGIASFGFDGTLDTRWGGDGVVAIEGVGLAGGSTPGGLATDIRYLGHDNNGVVVATADGMIRRLKQNPPSQPSPSSQPSQPSSPSGRSGGGAIGWPLLVLLTFAGLGCHRCRKATVPRRQRSYRTVSPIRRPSP